MAERSGYSLRRIGNIIDGIHILIGAAVILMAVLAFLDTARFSVFFPAIFLLAAVLNIVTGWFTLKMYQRMTKKRITGIIYIVMGAALLALAAVSALSLWFHK